jgi:hypothetical protein
MESQKDDALRMRMASAILNAYTPDMFPGGTPSYERGYPVASQFSDSIVLSMSLLSGEPQGFDSFNYKLVRFCTNMLDHGFFVRGGVAMGLMFHEGHVVFGPALIEAIETGQKAKVPRIIFSDEGDSRDGLLRKSSDGEWFLDYLKYPLAQGYVHDKLTWLANYRLTIEAALKRFADGQYPDIREKYVWFARYFNAVAGEVGAEQIGSELI